MKLKRYEICESGGRGWAVTDRMSSSPWPKYFNMTLREAKEKCAELNIKGWELTWFEKLFLYTEHDVNVVQQGLKEELLENNDK